MPDVRGRSGLPRWWRSPSPAAPCPLWACSQNQRGQEEVWLGLGSGSVLHWGNELLSPQRSARAPARSLGLLGVGRRQTEPPARGAPEYPAPQCCCGARNTSSFLPCTRLLGCHGLAPAAVTSGFLQASALGNESSQGCRRRKRSHVLPSLVGKEVLAGGRVPPTAPGSVASWGAGRRACSTRPGLQGLQGALLPLPASGQLVAAGATVPPAKRSLLFFPFLCKPWGFLLCPPSHCTLHPRAEEAALGYVRTVPCGAACCAVLGCALPFLPPFLSRHGGAGVPLSQLRPPIPRGLHITWGRGQGLAPKLSCSGREQCAGAGTSCPS